MRFSDVRPLAESGPILHARAGTARERQSKASCISLETSSHLISKPQQASLLCLTSYAFALPIHPWVQSACPLLQEVASCGGLIFSGAYREYRWSSSNSSFVATFKHTIFPYHPSFRAQSSGPSLRVDHGRDICIRREGRKRRTPVVGSVAARSTLEGLPPNGVCSPYQLLNYRPKTGAVHCSAIVSPCGVHALVDDSSSTRVDK